MLSPSSQSCTVILHADDFGMNARVNAGILRSFLSGLLSSTSILVNAPAAEDAVKQWKTLFDAEAFRSPEVMRLRAGVDDSGHPWDLGIHLNLTQGKPLTADRYPSELLDASGHFVNIVPLFLRSYRTSNSLWDRVSTELEEQISWMLDHSLQPTHLNGHQYVELIPQVAQRIPELLDRFSIPAARTATEPALIRNVWLQGQLKDGLVGQVKRRYASKLKRRLQTRNVRKTEAYFGTCHAGRINLQVMKRYFAAATSFDSIEIGMHPGEQAAATNRIEPEPVTSPWFDPLASGRSEETDLLCSEELKKLFLQNKVQLGRFSLAT